MAFSLPKARIQGFAPQVPYNFTRDGALDSLNTWVRENSPTCTTITSPADYSVTYNNGPYRGLILGADGNLYSPPWAATGGVLKINPITNTATIESFGLSGLTKDGGNYVCGALAPNGKIYCPPYNPGTILIIDPATGTSTRSNMGASLGATEKYTTCVLGPDGKIYAPGRTNCLIIDPVKNTATTTTFGGVITTTTTIFRWGSGVRALANDKLYFSPLNVPSGFIGGQVLIIDTATQTAKVTRFGSGATTAMGRGMTYSGIANNQSGLLWMLPYGETDFAYGTRKQYITYINPISETSIDIDVTQNSPYDPSARRCMGTVSGADHGVYGAPYINGNDTYIAWYDGLETSKYGGVPSAYLARWWGGCMAANGKIYSLPDMGSGVLPFPTEYKQILVLQTYGSGTSVTGFRDLISTSYFNKGGT